MVCSGKRKSLQSFALTQNSGPLLLQIPSEILDWARSIFSEVNRRIAEKLLNVPGIHESHLDTTMIEHLTNFGSPRRFRSNWVARIETHYLGGLHQFRRWEIADIGVFVFLQHRGHFIRKKVALLQSKRLYPRAGDIEHIEEFDYYVGMPRLAIRDEPVATLLTETTYEFDEDCRYRALVAGDDQCKAIKAHLMAGNAVPVFYMTYNPPRSPLTIKVPLRKRANQAAAPRLGTRVIPSAEMFELLASKRDGYSPSLADTRNIVRHRDSAGVPFGWRLEYFITELLLGCHEGRLWVDPQEVEMLRIFERKSGPISAAVSITIEIPDKAKVE